MKTNTESSPDATEAAFTPANCSADADTTGNLIFTNMKTLIRALLALVSACFIMHGCFLIHEGLASLVAGVALYWATCLLFAEKPNALAEGRGSNT